MAEDTKYDEKDENHDCELNKCTGKTFNSLNLKCSNCEKKYYLSCVYRKNCMFELLSAIQMLTFNTEKQKLEVNITNETKKNMGCNCRHRHTI